MNKTVGIILGVVVVAAVIVGVTLGSNKAPGEKGGSESVSGTFQELARLGKSYQCTFSKEDEEFGNLTGEVFVANENIRGSYDWTDTAGTSSSMEVLVDDEFNYFWGSSEYGEFALKTAVEETEEVPTGEEARYDATGEEFEFDCKRWSPRPGTFDPPSDVDFNEFTLPQFDLSGGEVEFEGTAQMNICETCDALPEGEARTQCLEGLAQFGC